MKGMKPKVILINPWIYDVAAVNLWSRPLGLLKVAEYLSRFNVDLRLIDCTDIFRHRKFGMGKYPRQIIEKPEMLSAIPKNFARYGIRTREFRENVKRLLPCDLILVTSIMSHWYPGVQKVIEIVNSLSPDTPVILGGIYATLFSKHAADNSGADYIFKGHISETFNNVLDRAGIAMNQQHIPRPYYKLGLYRSYPFAPIITSSGCPYRCSYCSSPLLFDEFMQREPHHVVKEIRDLYDRGVRDYAFYDDALLVNAESHLKILLKEVIRSETKIRFHCPNGIHARFIDDEIAHLMKRSGFVTLRVSLETVNTERQQKTGGKVTSDMFRSAVDNLKRAGFMKEHIGVYLMYGLPGQGLEEVKEGVEFLKGLGVRINLTEFSPIPGTLCWEELKSKGILSDDIDPLLTNNSVFTTLFSGYDMGALESLRLDVKKYNSN